MGRQSPRLRIFERARELLKQFRGDGYQLVAATSASDEDVDALLEPGGLAGLIPAATTSDNADQSKPAPDIIEAALKKVNVVAAVGHPSHIRRSTGPVG